MNVIGWVHCTLLLRNIRNLWDNFLVYINFLLNLLRYSLLNTLFKRESIVDLPPSINQG